MKQTTLAVLASIAIATLANGGTLDWSSFNWSDGALVGTINALSNNGAPNSAITPLTYDFGDGLTASVAVSYLQGAGAIWRNGTNYNGDALSVDQLGHVFTLGVVGGPSASAALSIHFSSAVVLNSLTIGDVDTNADLSDAFHFTAWDGRTSIPADVQSLGQAAANLAVFSSVVTGSATLTSIGIDATPLDIRETQGRAKLGNARTVTDLVFVLSQTGTGTGTGTETGTGGHAVWFSNLGVTAIPEPSAYALVFGCGSLALFGVRRCMARRS